LSLATGCREELKDRSEDFFVLSVGDQTAAVTGNTRRSENTRTAGNETSSKPMSADLRVSRQRL
jgi:hypothetical protein